MYENRLFVTLGYSCKIPIKFKIEITLNNCSKKHQHDTKYIYLYFWNRNAVQQDKTTVDLLYFITKQQKPHKQNPNGWTLPPKGSLETSKQQ